MENVLERLVWRAEGSGEESLHICYQMWTCGARGQRASHLGYLGKFLTCLSSDLCLVHVGCTLGVPWQDTQSALGSNLGTGFGRRMFLAHQE
jgi:hypothetical protein